MHRLLERQIKRALEVDPAAWTGLAETLRNHAESIAGESPDLARALSGIPTLLERVSEGYGQLERDQTLLRRSLDLSSEELTDANQRLREEARATSQALASLHFAFDLLLEGYQEDLPGQEANSLVDLSQKVLWLTRQREQMRQALKASEERFELAMRGANDGLWDWDLNSGSVYYSPRWKEMIGHGIDEIDDSPEEWSERIHPADLPTAMAAMHNYILGAESHYESTFRFRHKDGHYLWILSRGIAVRDASGEVVRIVGTHSDITQRTELQRHLSQFKHALDEHAIVSMTDTHGDITYANDKFCEISGYRLDELLGRNHRLVKSGLHPPEFYEELWRVVSAGGVWRGEICNRARNGELYWVLATIAPILDDDGRPAQYISLRANITASKLAEASMRQAKEAAEAASRAKSEFLANVSHEIRTPMNGVLGMLDLTLDTNLDAEQRDYIQTAHQSAEALLDIINDILDLSKIESGRLDIHAEQVDITELARQCAQLFAPRCQAKGLRFTVDIDPHLPSWIETDPVRLRQILLNLLGNAVKFTEAGGVALGARAQDDLGVVFSVSDTGIGIPAEKQASIFEAFTQADGSITRKYGGTGLGLTISRRLARLMGGELSLASLPGEGSTFRFVLPMTRIGPPPQARTAITRGLRVLIAEDNPINQKLATTLLEKAGHHVTVVATGRAAIDSVARERSYDLILMDMHMPDIDGFEATRQIRAQEAAQGLERLPVIALSASTLESDRREGIDAGMDDFLEKPLRRDALHAMLERWGRKGSAPPGAEHLDPVTD
jgi:PAS domain S-box-containing protein